MFTHIIQCVQPNEETYISYFTFLTIPDEVLKLNY